MLRVYLVLAAFIFSGGALRLLGTFLLASYSSVALGTIFGAGMR